MTHKNIKTQEKPPSSPASAFKPPVGQNIPANEPKRLKNGLRGFAQGQVFPIFEGMAQASALTGAPEALLKAAKRKGCEAFISGGRIDCAKLLPFLFAMVAAGSDLPEGFNSWREVLESEKAKREAIKRQVDEKSVMPTADAERQAAEACAFIDSELQRGENELPPVLAGLPAVECGKILHGFTEKVRANAKAKFQEIGK